MARPLRMPSQEQLPPGVRREFVQHLFQLYGQAGRPTLEQISAAITNEYEGTASRETVRRILSGATLSSWKNVRSLFLVLCQMAGEDPAEDWELVRDLSGYSSAVTRQQVLRDQWNAAFDFPAPDANPWGSPA